MAALMNRTDVIESPWNDAVAYVLSVPILQYLLVSVQMRAITVCMCFLAAYAIGSTQTFPGIVLPSRASFRQDARHLSFTCPVGYELHTD